MIQPVLMVLAVAGCQILHAPTAVDPPTPAASAWPSEPGRDPPLRTWLYSVPEDWPEQLAERRAAFEIHPSPVTAAELAEAHYAVGDVLEFASDPRSVDHFFHTLAFSRFALLHAAPPLALDAERMHRLKYDALVRLIDTGQRFGRLDPATGLRVDLPRGPTWIAVQPVGFPWQRNDFDRLVPYGRYRDRRLTRAFQHPGIGVPLVAVRIGSMPPVQRFLLRETFFSATAVLEPSIALVADVLPASPGAPPAAGAPPRRADLASLPTPDSGGRPEADQAVLRLYNPLTVACAETPAGPQPLAADISVPFAASGTRETYSPLRAFLSGSGGGERSQLFFLEPYQHGKIPLIFVHGLLSDPSTFVDMANELRADPVLRQRYQIWSFRYPTGQAFLRSAAELRAQLRQAFASAGPPEHDPAAYRAVLVGHSMGGLLARLQVTSSGAALWQSVANRPLASIRASADQRQELAEMFFFQPVPQVERVIFIATPHRGSNWAYTGVGQVAALLARRGAENRAPLDRVFATNAEAFHRSMRGGLPTSIELLRPGAPILNAINQLPFRHGVCLHSIIGTGHPLPLTGPADGVVPVASALLPQAVSTTFVHATHTGIQRDDRTFAELQRILRQHGVGAPPERELEAHPGAFRGKGSPANNECPSEAGLSPGALPELKAKAPPRGPRPERG